MPQKYGATVSIALSGNTITGWKGFTSYLERIDPGVFALKLDANLADFEFAVNAQVINPPVGSETKWSTTTYKWLNPPMTPPGMYIIVVTSKDGTPQDIDFDVTASTFK
ncbi:MAG TPA: hypothetical protein PK156_19040 [Polyangium sp.]|nr:hypothetical protein [Polyangium sp.]